MKDEMYGKVVSIAEPVIEKTEFEKEVDKRNQFKEELRTLDLSKYTTSTLTAVFFDLSITFAIFLGMTKEVMLENMGTAYDYYKKGLPHDNT